MHPLPFRTIAYLSLDLVLVACCVLRVPDLRTRARCPFDVLEVNGKVAVSTILASDACPEVALADEIRSVRGAALVSDRSVEFLCDAGVIGEQALVVYVRGGVTHQTSVTLIPYFSGLYIVMVLLFGIATFLVAIYVFFRRAGDITAAALHWTLMSLGACVVLAWEGKTPQSMLGAAYGVVFFLTYTVIAAGFLLFTTMFPRPKQGRVATKAVAIFLPVGAITVAVVLAQQHAFATLSLQVYEHYLGWFDTFHAALIVYVAAGILNFIHSYRHAGSQEERKKLKWLLFGLAAGPFPFLVLTVLPMTVAPQFLVPETYTLVFLLAIPISFAISFIRYHVLDIDVVINRAAVYTMVIGVLLVLYVLLVGGVAQIVGQYTEELPVITAVVVALLFQPARLRVQRIVDRRFFRVRYNFRETERRVVAEIKRSLGVRHLAGLVVEQIDTILPLERIAFVVLRGSMHGLQVLAHRNFPGLEPRAVRLDVALIVPRLQRPLALGERLEAGVDHEQADRDLFRSWGIVMALPMVSERHDVLGFLFLGEKKSGARYTLEDVDLLNAVSVQAGLAIERLELQERLVLEHAEKNRLEDLNRLKSDFVSYVSHELRTPLTAIRIFAELLQRRVRTGDRKARSYILGIEGESCRLDRMVTAILDSAKIDQGLRLYSSRATDLRTVACHVMEVMRYQLDRQGFAVTFSPGRRLLPLLADADAVADAMINLIGNSIKYSASRKSLSVRLSGHERSVSCRIKDAGIGISAAALPHLFERFYRDPASKSATDGVGLGLSIVKHIMDAHNGRIAVESTPGKGTTITLTFPRQGTRPDRQGGIVRIGAPGGNAATRHREAE